MRVSSSESLFDAILQKHHAELGSCTRACRSKDERGPRWGSMSSDSGERDDQWPNASGESAAIRKYAYFATVSMPHHVRRIRWGRLDSQRARDEFFHDFVGAGVDLLDPCIGVHVGDGVFQAVAVSAEHLEASVDDRALLIGQPVLGHRGRGCIEIPPDESLDAIVDEGP